VNVVHALALRRVLLASSAVSATVAAHHASAGGLHLTPAAPVAWGLLITLVVLCGARRRFVPRGVALTALALAVSQACAHAVLTAAPWALGLSAHAGGTPLVDARSFTVHAVAAVFLTLLLAGADRIIAAAAAAARLLAGHLRRRPPRGGPGGRFVLPHRAPRSRRVPGPRSARAPPAASSPVLLGIR
jgi:hypothetical protein